MAPAAMPLWHQLTCHSDTSSLEPRQSRLLEPLRSRPPWSHCSPGPPGATLHHKHNTKKKEGQPRHHQPRPDTPTPKEQPHARQRTEVRFQNSTPKTHTKKKKANQDTTDRDPTPQRPKEQPHTIKAKTNHDSFVPPRQRTEV